MNNTEWRPRLSLEITQKQYNKLQKLLPWRLKTKIFSMLIDDLINVLEEGPESIGALISRSIKIVNNKEK